MALRLVAACQKGKEANVTNIALTDPPPRFNGIDHASLDGRSKWSIDKDEQTRYEHLFQVREWSTTLITYQGHAHTALIVVPNQ